MTNSHYNKSFKPLARKLRNDSTPGEIKLWSEVLRARGMKGYQFNRQFPIDRFIVDFICRKLKLVIELDGKYHENQLEKDKRRDVRLNELGYQVLRISESEVMKDLQNVIRTIEITIEEKELSALNPPNPLS